MIKSLLIILLLSTCFMVAAPAPAQAKDLFSSQVCSGADTSKTAVCGDNAKTSPTQDPFSGPHGLLIKITNIVAFVGGVAAVIMIIVGAIRFITSGSDSSTGSRTDTDVESARRTVGTALVGLAVIILAHTIILFVLHKL